MHNFAMHYALMGKEFGDRLKEARKARGMTAAEAASALRMPYSAFKAHENGSRGGEHLAPRYAAFFKCDLRWLLTGAGPRAARMPAPPFAELPDKERREAELILEYLRNRGNAS